MDGKSEAMIQSLMMSNGLKFEEWFRATRDKILISRQTFSTRKKELEDSKIVEKKKKKYFIKKDRKRTKAFGESAKNYRKLEKIIDRIQYRPNPFNEGYRHILEALYFHNLFTFWLISGIRIPEYYDKHQLKNSIKEMEKIIVKVLDNLGKKNFDSTRELIHVIENKLEADHMSNIHH